MQRQGWLSMIDKAPHDGLSSTPGCAFEGLQDRWSVADAHVDVLTSCARSQVVGCVVPSSSGCEQEPAVEAGPDSVVALLYESSQVCRAPFDGRQRDVDIEAKRQLLLRSGGCIDDLAQGVEELK